MRRVVMTPAEIVALQARLEELEQCCEDLEHDLAEQEYALEEAQDRIDLLQDQVGDYESRSLLHPTTVMDRLQEYLDWVQNPTTCDPAVQSVIADTLLEGVRREVLGR
jgi:uncharacterized coiled-coil protein SlyX